MRNPGQTLRAGEEVVQIVPSHAPLVIKAAVGSDEKGKIKVDQKVQMRGNHSPCFKRAIAQAPYKMIAIANIAHPLLSSE